MKVDKINQQAYNWVTKKQLPAESYHNSANVNFTALPTLKATRKALFEALPWGFKVLDKLKSTKGEAQNIIINALGTGLIAPIFIKWNFLSKTDEDTRTYSAWRQPISAVLAVATQVGIVIPFDKMINQAVDGGNHFGYKYNQSAFADKKYIMKQLSKLKENSALTKDQLSKLADEKVAANKKKMIDNLLNDNKIEFKKKTGGKTILERLPAAEYKRYMKETYKDLLNTESEEFNKYKNIKTEKTKIRAEYYVKNNDYCTNFMNEVETEMHKCKNVKEFRKYLSGKMKTLKGNTEHAELRKILSEIYNRGIAGNQESVFNEMKYKVGKVKFHIKKYSVMKSQQELKKSIITNTRATTKELKQVVDFLEEQHANIDKLSVGQLQNNIKKEINKFNNKKVLSKIIKMEPPKDAKSAKIFNQVLKDLKQNLSGLDNEKILVKLESIIPGIGENIQKSRLSDYSYASKVAEKYMKDVQNNIKNLKQIVGLGVSFAILPLTCSLLNWIYPKFMDAIFPNLSNKKHSNESTNLIEKATKKSEVA